MGYRMERILFNNFLGNRKASIGIGAMIVFIAMVLVAGIAASVLIQTSTTLEMQALKTGSQTISEVSSGVMVESVEGFNVSGSITRLAIEIKARAGSPDIDLETTVVEISDSDNKYVLKFDSDPFTLSNETNGNVFTSGFYPNGDAGTTFSVVVLQDADGSCTSSTPTINFGDHVIIGIGNLFSGLVPRTDVFGMIIAEEGSPGVIGFTTPASYTDAVMELQ